MSKYINKYFNWLGIQNEGIRRIILTIYPLTAIIFAIWLEIEEEWNTNANEIK